MRQQPIFGTFCAMMFLTLIEMQIKNLIPRPDATGGHAG